ncbi:uncharacterized protein V6R79_000414 [Siganus canaliculatus]
MAGELQRVRKRFVEKASIVLIGELLDDLLDDEVVTEGEKDWILQHNNVTTDKARCLIDTVKKKDELKKVRTNFVAKASIVLITELLDDLLEEDVVTDGEKNWILEEDNVTANKARRLIDTVKSKGHEPSRKMIDHLQLRDPCLSNELGLSCDAAKDWSTSLISTTDAFWRRTQRDSSVYPVTKISIKSRVALMISNIQFTHNNRRNGAEKDEENMEKLLRSLGYEVVKYTNLTAKEIDDAFAKFSKHPKVKDTDSVVIVIMSHGKLGAVFGVNFSSETSDEFPINNIYKRLGPTNCPALVNKPKIIIIQGCRLEMGGSVFSSGPEDDVADVHKEKDFISLLSCTPDTLSFRHIAHGSFFIQYIIDVVNTYAHCDNIYKLFTRVSFELPAVKPEDEIDCHSLFFNIAGELQSVRKNFVAKVSIVLIGELLDDLLDDEVVTEGEKDWILQHNNVTTDKARRLIDIVKKKGDVASRKMIDYLKQRDSVLYAELGLPCDQPPRPAAEPVKKEGSTSLIPTTDSFWEEKQKDSSVYPVTKISIKSRVALLITNIQFTHNNRRNGAEKDEENMEKLLQSLEYEVVKYTNLTAKEIDDAFAKFSKHPKLKDTDSVVIVIMSHGKLGSVLGVNFTNNKSGDEKPDEFPINNIYKHLGPTHCPALVDKPKIIIIQACRGEMGGSVILSDSANPAVYCDNVQEPGPAPLPAEDSIEDDVARCVHREKDFISLLSCTPDTVSYRSRVDGSFLIQYFVDVVNNYARCENIHKLFTRVMQRFEKAQFNNEKQMPTIDRCTAVREFFFYPGL